jgi:Ca2+-transporting ATPase
VGFLLGTNIGEVVVVFMAMLLWQVTPLLSMQLLWINLVTDSLPAIALGMEPVEKDVMNKKPKPKTEGLFAHGYGVKIILQGIMFGGLALASFYFGQMITGTLEGGRTTAFITLSVSQIVQVFNMRSEHSLFRIGFFTNKKLNLAALASLLLVIFVLFTPGVRTAFALELLGWQGYLLGFGLAIVPFFVMEISKLIAFLHEKRIAKKKVKK